MTAESRNISIKDSRRSVSGLFLAFGSDRSPFYKVISIRREKKYSPLFGIEIYDSQTMEWTRLEKWFTAAEANFFKTIFWNNVIYWLRKSNAENSSYLDFETGMVRRFERALTHKRRNIGSQKHYVMESNGHLHYVSLYSGRNKTMLKVSELLQDDLEWLEKYNVDLKPVSSEFEEILGSQVAVLCLVRGDKEEESAVLFLMQEKIIFYRFCDGYFQDLLHLPTKDFYRHGHLHYQHDHAYQFVQSLVPV